MYISKLLAKLGLFSVGICVTNYCMGFRDVWVEWITIALFWTSFCFFGAYLAQKYEVQLRRSYEFLYRVYLHSTQQQMVECFLNMLRAIAVIGLLLGAGS